MRTFKLQVQTTLDGYMAGPDGEPDWMSDQWSWDLEDRLRSLMDGVDGIVLGRRMAEDFVPYWGSRPDDEDAATAEWMNATPRYVVSRTLEASPWSDVELLRGELADSIGDLRARPGGDLITYGGSELVSSLIREQLLDELHLFVHPVSIGRGLPVFPTDVHHGYRLVAATAFECGIAGLQYTPAGDRAADNRTPGDR